MAKSSPKRSAAQPKSPSKSSPMRITALAVLASAGGLAAFPFRSQPAQVREREVRTVSTPRITADAIPTDEAQSFVPDSYLPLPRKVPFAGVTATSSSSDGIQPRLLPSHREATPPSIPDQYEPLVVPSRQSPEFLDQESIPPAIRPEQMKEIVQQGRWPMEAAPLEPREAPTARLQSLTPEPSNPGPAVSPVGWANRSLPEAQDSRTVPSHPRRETVATLPASPLLTETGLTDSRPSDQAATLFPPQGISDRASVNSPPNHTSPAHTSPAHTSPAHTSPAHTSPAHTSPAHTSPAHTSPAHTSQSPTSLIPQSYEQAVSPPVLPEGSPNLMPAPNPGNLFAAHPVQSVPSSAVGTGLAPTPDPISSPIPPASGAIAGRNASSSWSTIDAPGSDSASVANAPQLPIYPVAGIPPTTPAPPRDTATRASGWRVYKVRDGDSLESIAQALLGDPYRARELYEANRDSLGPSGALPLGAVLVIPPVQR